MSLQIWKLSNKKVVHLERTIYFYNHEPITDCWLFAEWKRQQLCRNRKSYQNWFENSHRKCFGVFKNFYLTNHFKLNLVQWWDFIASMIFWCFRSFYWLLRNNDNVLGSLIYFILRNNDKFRTQNILWENESRIRNMKNIHFLFSNCVLLRLLS